MMKLDKFDVDRPGLERVEQLGKLAEDAAMALDTAAFFEALRASDVPYLAHKHREDPRALFDTTVAAVHRLGQSSPAIALGVSQHLSSMWAFTLTRRLLAGGDALAAAVAEFLAEVIDRRLLIANTTSQAGSDRIGASGTSVTATPESITVDGWSTYMSLATEADKVTFVARMPDGAQVAVLADLRGEPALRVSEDLLFGEYMVLADTRKLFFDHIEVPWSRVIGPDPRLAVFYTVQLMCQNLCIAALNLGGARRMLDETRRHGHRMTTADGESLVRSEAFSCGVGRLAVSYVAAERLVRSLVDVVVAIDAGLADDPDTAADGLLQVMAVKHTVVRLIESIAVESRKLVGTRAFMNDHPVARIGGEVVFGALGSATEKGTERQVGARYLEA